MYSNKIMEEFFNVERYGVIKGADGVGKIVSDIGSEIIKIYIKVEGNKIVDCQFQTFGGVVAIACSSVATKLILGKSISTAEKISTNDIVSYLGEVPENKEYLAQAVVNAVHKSIFNYKNKSNDD